MDVLGALTSLLPLIKTQYPDINDNFSLSQSNDALCLFGVTRFYRFYRLHSPFERGAGRFAAQRDKGRLDTHIPFSSPCMYHAFTLPGKIEGVS
jgi:hypothetical protein